MQSSLSGFLRRAKRPLIVNPRDGTTFNERERRQARIAREYQRTRYADHAEYCLSSDGVLTRVS